MTRSIFAVCHSDPHHRWAGPPRNQGRCADRGRRFRSTHLRRIFLLKSSTVSGSQVALRPLKPSDGSSIRTTPKSDKHDRCPPVAEGEQRDCLGFCQILRLNPFNESRPSSIAAAHVGPPRAGQGRSPNPNHPLVSHSLRSHSDDLPLTANRTPVRATSVRTVAPPVGGGTLRYPALVGLN